MFKEKSGIKILFFGPKGSYTDTAKDNFVEKFNLDVAEEIPQNAIISILHKLDEVQDEKTFAVIPIENSIEGVVRETLDNLTRLKDRNIKILAEIALPIEHCLITRAERFGEIKTISSYTQGIAQCREYIEVNFSPDVTINTSGSTAQAVKDLLHQDSSFAAIASQKAAEIYGFPVLAKGINDEKDNKTRFVLIGRGETPRTGQDKTSITFSTENTHGALCKVLNILNKYEINMSYIDSRPSKKFLGEYTFYIDIDGHVKDEKVAKALFELLPYTKLFRHLGSFGKMK